MTLQSDIRRWLFIGCLGLSGLMLPQLYWLAQNKHSGQYMVKGKWKWTVEEQKRGQTERGVTAATHSQQPEQKPFDIQSCTPDPTMFLSNNISTPFKIFIYDLPKRFNYDIVKCNDFKQCIGAEYCGLGKELYTDGIMSVHDTNQFSLEVVLHHQLLFSSYRTLDPFKADAMYIPAYTGIACFCKDIQNFNHTSYMIKELFKLLKQQPNELQNKPHFSALGKIQREQSSEKCPLLRFPESKKVIYATIEEENNPAHKRYLGVEHNRVINVPYPSFAHFQNSNTPTEFETLPLEERRVFVFLASGIHPKNDIRAKVMAAFTYEQKTKESFEEFYAKEENAFTSMVFLQTVECFGNYNNTVMPWMQHSVFCLQPQGDSPTRKSFYDAIMGGCIPVLFHHKRPVAYPFTSRLDYQNFTVTIDPSDILVKDKKIFDLLSSIPRETIVKKLQAVREVAKWLQYPVPDGHFIHSGALQMFLNEIEDILKAEKSTK